MISRLISRLCQTSLHSLKSRAKRGLIDQSKWSGRYATSATSHNDPRNLIACFDHPSTSTSSALRPTGLFQDERLATPESFKVLASKTLADARALVQRIVDAPSDREELHKVVKNLDRLSDLLCSVIDLAELVRHAHPDQKWAFQANEVYESLCEYMNVLNTHQELDKALGVVMADKDIMNALSEEALQTAHIFSQDFDRSGIHLPQEQRSQFVALSSEIVSLGQAFLNNASGARPPAQLSARDVQGLRRTGRLLRQSVTVYPGTQEAQEIMTAAPEESARRKVYLASNSSTQEQLQILEQLLKARANLAKVVGFSSFAAMSLEDKMAKTPENVNQFLKSLADHMRPQAAESISLIRQRKQSHLATLATSVQQWDRDYYLPSKPPVPAIEMPYLTTGTVFRALCRLFEQLYGISLNPKETRPGEVWHQDVQKLEVVDEEKGILGWVYTDLYSRPGKSTGAAHYTVQCSRLLDFEDDLRPAEGRTGYAVRWDNELWQLPIVVLMCPFSGSPSGRRPAVLEWYEVQTLFHEMGHALHSMVGRTEYHNVSGTRCATDFVELPSILMEHFLTATDVLKLFHAESTSSVTARPSAMHTSTSALDSHHQILLALLDQSYHSPAVLENSFDSTDTLLALQQSHDVFPPVVGAAWQTQFSHLYGYGATYYSYLFDRAIASQVWRKLFQRRPLNRESGERFKTEILKWGGGKDPWRLVSSILDNPELSEGGAEAMRQVGKWRVEEAGVAGQGIH